MLTFFGIMKFVALNSGKAVEEAPSSIYLCPDWCLFSKKWFVDVIPLILGGCNNDWKSLFEIIQAQVMDRSVPLSARAQAVALLQQLDYPVWLCVILNLAQILVCMILEHFAEPMALMKFIAKSLLPVFNIPHISVHVQRIISAICL